MNREDFKPDKQYKIKMPKSRYNGRVAKARGISAYNDVTLEFKNGKQVVFSICWLENYPIRYKVVTSTINL